MHQRWFRIQNKIQKIFATNLDKLTKNDKQVWIIDSIIQQNFDSIISPA